MLRIPSKLVFAIIYAVLLSVGGLILQGQSVISAKSGVVHYIEGDVTLDGQIIVPKFAEFPGIQPNQTLATEEGRAEILLTPGVFLRLTEHSSVKMLANALTDTKLEVLSGSTFIEVGELLLDNSVTFTVGTTLISLPKTGLYRIDATPARLRVYEGRAIASTPNGQVTAKKAQEIDLEAPLSATKFDAKATDGFYRWSARRAGYLAAANVTSAHLASRNSFGSAYSGRSAWSWNPYFGMYTFMPRTGIYYSPFGNPFYSPAVAGAFLFGRYAWGNSGGYSAGMGGPGAGYSRGGRPFPPHQQIPASSSGPGSSPPIPMGGAARYGGPPSRAGFGGGEGRAGGPAGMRSGPRGPASR